MHMKNSFYGYLNVNLYEKLTDHACAISMRCGTQVHLFDSSINVQDLNQLDEEFQIIIECLLNTMTKKSFKFIDMHLVTTRNNKVIICGIKYIVLSLRIQTAVTIKASMKKL